MQVGKILVAEQQGTYLVKMVGDVRLTLCTTIDEYFDNMFAQGDFCCVIIDLSEAEGIDSTSLGLLAKLAVKAKQLYQLVPTIISPNPNITRLLESMGFGLVFTILSEMPTEHDGYGEIPVIAADEECVRCKVIEAHRELMSLNENNRALFAELVSTLEASR